MLSKSILVIFIFCAKIVIYCFSGSKPHTMSVKWQKATDEYMKFHKMNPIFGTQKPLVYLKMDNRFDFKHY